MGSFPQLVDRFNKEASQTRDYCVAKSATLRAARPDPSPRQVRASQDDNSYSTSSRDFLLCDQGRFYGIVEINLLDGGVGLGALPADAIDVGDGAGGHDFVDLTEAESGAQASGDANRLLGFALG